MIIRGDFTMIDKTMTFKIGNDNEDVMKETLTQVYDALREKGYNVRTNIYTVEEGRKELLSVLKGGKG